MTFTLAVCSEMVYLDEPHLDRVSASTTPASRSRLGLDGQGRRGPGRNGRAVHVDDRLRERRPDQPRRATALLASAAESIEFARRIGAPALNLHGTGLGEGGLPVRPVEIVTGEMWLGALRTLERVAELGEQHEMTFVLENLNTEVDHPGTPFARAADTLALVAAVGVPTCA